MIMCTLPYIKIFQYSLFKQGVYTNPKKKTDDVLSIIKTQLHNMLAATLQQAKSPQIKFRQRQLEKQIPPHFSLSLLHILTDLNVLRTNATRVLNESGGNVPSRTRLKPLFLFLLLLCVNRPQSNRMSQSLLVCVSIKQKKNTVMRFQLKQYLTNEPKTRT